MKKNKNRTAVKNETWKFYSYDVWGNAKDGYEVNQSFRTDETYEFPESATDKQIWDCLKQQGFIKKYCRFNLAEIDNSHEDVIYIDYKGRPEGEFRLEEKE